MSYSKKEPVSTKGTEIPFEASTKGTSFAERLRMAIGDRSIRSFATESGISYGALHKYFSGLTQPTLDNLVILSEKTGCSIEWLATGKEKDGAIIPAPNSSHHGEAVVLDTAGHDIDSREFIFVPRYDVRAAAGYGAWNETEEPAFTMAFRKYWIENILHANPEKLSVISVYGDSMEGVFNDKDVILINHEDNEPVEGIYVLRIDGQLIVKRVQRLPGAKLRISSTNTAYEPFCVDLNQLPVDFAIIGRVVWFGRTI